jgi:hypothetical protein
LMTWVDVIHMQVHASKVRLSTTHA